MAKDEKNKNKKEPKKNKEQKSSFLKESKAELKKVNWPKPKRLANDTATVIVIVLIVAIIVFILDFIFLTLNEQLIIKSEEKIKNSTNTSIITENIDTTENTELETNDVELENEENSSEDEVIDSEVENTDINIDNAEETMEDENIEDADQNAEIENDTVE